jgi:hypothetical protein
MRERLAFAMTRVAGSQTSDAIRLRVGRPRRESVFRASPFFGRLDEILATDIGSTWFGA